MIKTILETGQLGYILFFSVYGIDAVITIFIRLKIKKTFSSHIVHIYISICEMVGPMFWFHLFMPNSTSSKWTRCLYGNERRSELFLYNRDFIYTDTSLFLDKKIGFRKMISQDSQFVLIIMFQYLKKNYGKTCF
jgi:hypothetical protein